MHVAELWRYPVKSLAGEPLREVSVTGDGFARDREIVVVNREDRMVTSRTKPRLLGLKGTTGEGDSVFVDDLPWDSPDALDLVQAAAGPDVRLVRYPSVRRFDVLPLLVATDGAVRAMNVDRRRFRPNILLGGVEGLAERTWPGRTLRIGHVEIHLSNLRDRCVMTTYDPDTLAQDVNVLRRIVREFEGSFALDSAVVKPGVIRVGDAAEIVG
jgi:uncharacterized protein